MTLDKIATDRTLPIVSGGFGLFRRNAVIVAGGHRHGHLRWHRGLKLVTENAMSVTLKVRSPAAR